MRENRDNEKSEREKFDFHSLLLLLQQIIQIFKVEK